MTAATLLDLSAIAAMVPLLILSLRVEEGRGGLYWLLFAVAVVGPAARALGHALGGWDAGFSAALWLTVAASLVLFAALVGVSRHAWRLTALVVGYLIVAGALATIWEGGHPAPTPRGAALAWLMVHIAVSLLTYAFVTLSALAALGTLLQERALKDKRKPAYTRLLPPVAEGDRLVIRLLAFGEGVLALGLVSGMSINALAGLPWLRLDHKTLLSLLAFAVIGILLAAHWRSGLRGRSAVRVVLLAWLLLTLAYPGVKFVTEVLLGRA